MPDDSKEPQQATKSDDYGASSYDYRMIPS
jgi:hypothetical protein